MRPHAGRHVGSMSMANRGRQKPQQFSSKLLNRVKENGSLFLHIVPFSKWLLWSWSIAFDIAQNGAEAGWPSPVGFSTQPPMGCLARWNCFPEVRLLHSSALVLDCSAPSLYIFCWQPHPFLLISTPSKKKKRGKKKKKWVLFNVFPFVSFSNLRSHLSMSSMSNAERVPFHSSKQGSSYHRWWCWSWWWIVWM